jgi:cell division transport system ATP-binding protein
MLVVEPILRFEHVSASYSGFAALADISFTARPGELVHVAGRSGAGKTTLLRLINREIKLAGGRLWVAGQPLHALRRRHLATLRRTIGVVYQDYGLLRSLTARENVEFAYRVSHVLEPLRQARGNAIEALRCVDLEDRADAFPNQLSGGEQQRVAIARALVSSPAVLLADEPTGNLDKENSRAVAAILSRVADEGALVVIATHDPALLKGARRVLTLERGSLVSDTGILARAS